MIMGVREEAFQFGDGRCTECFRKDTMVKMSLKGEDGVS